MKRKSLVLIGAGGHARVVLDVVRQAAEYTVVGLVDQNPALHGTTLDGVPILGGDDQVGVLRRQGVTDALVAIGDNETRCRLASAMVAHGFLLATAVHPKATIAPHVSIGAGTVVMAGAVVNPGASIGPNAIVNTGATVDHDCTIEECVHIAPGVHLGGGVRVGKLTLIGIGACVVKYKTIGCNVVVGAGAVVIDDIPDRVLAVGVPARVVRER